MNKLFFRFAAAHSFLMGLLPFYIPLLLWQLNIPLWQISFFIAVSGLGFLVALPAWQFLQQKNHWLSIFVLSFALEILLLALLLALRLATPGVGLETDPDLAILLLVSAFINGAYLCFYWTSQRTLFVMLTIPSAADKPVDNVGKKFGDFQIIVMLLLKLGILLGAFLLDRGFEVLLLALSISTAAFALKMMNTHASKLQPLKLDSLKRDFATLDNRSKGVFFLDGIFLYLESYFWLLSLYLIAQQDVMTLGLIVVSLSILLALLFFVIKNKIDAAPAQKVFQLAFVGYALSWILRSQLEFESDMVYPLILAIAFLTSFFRLSFNKRFFEYAHQQDVMSYLLLKSYLSQFAIFIFFIIVGFYGLFAGLVITELSIMYAIAAPLALLYGFYGESSDLRFKKVSHA
jgi:hypothetical protein